MAIPLILRFHSLLTHEEIASHKKHGVELSRKQLSQELVSSCLNFLPNQPLEENILQ